MSDWNSEQYTKFERERTQPSVDLISRIDAEPKTILDIGCGPGNSTNQLRRRFPTARITGIDNSANMLEKARASYPQMRFEMCSVPDGIGTLGTYDLVFSNACLHWIPHHRELYRILMGKVNPGGAFAVQMPLVQHAPFYKIVGEMTAEEKWKNLRTVKNFHNLLPEETYDALLPVSGDIAMWDTTYYHVVSSHRSVIDWYKGSGLRPYLDMLDGAEQAEFLGELLARIKERFPMQQDGTILLKMPRLFFIARQK